MFYVIQQMFISSVFLFMFLGIGAFVGAVTERVFPIKNYPKTGVTTTMVSTAGLLYSCLDQSGRPKDNFFLGMLIGIFVVRWFDGSTDHKH